MTRNQARKRGEEVLSLISEQHRHKFRLEVRLERAAPGWQSPTEYEWVLVTAKGLLKVRQPHFEWFEAQLFTSGETCITRIGETPWQAVKNAVKTMRALERELIKVSAAVAEVLKL